MSTEVRVPALGESVSEATVATWFKKPGDAVAVDEMLCELETDKVTVEVPSPVAGVLAEIIAPEGETVAPNALLAQIDTTGAGAGDAAPAATKEPAGQPAADEEQPKMAGKNIDVMVPTLGESVTEATVATWFKQPGDAVQQDEMLCELETDKVSVEVPAPASGVLAEILAPEGATVDAKAKLAIITEGATGAASAGGAGAKAAPVGPASGGEDGVTAGDVGSPGAGPEQMTPREGADQPSAGRSDVEDAPSAKKAMAEAGVSRDQVQGTGRDGRVMKDDVARAGQGAGAAPRTAQAPA
ncbi:biotin/lipoyl-containing protein, partial [Paracoccus sphaerophysae]